jgi:muramoyltetrapeptide carboxypeptidase LdcA involved in peptidoglycan recycling
MIYPEYIKKGYTIGVTAPSNGNKKETDFIRLNHGKVQLSKRGYEIIETAHVRTSEKGRSTDARTRTKELEELIKNDKVKWIISAKGGDFLLEMLPFVDYECIKAHPKWIQGYSDNTGLTYTITTHCDMATLYGHNFNDFGMEVWHKSLEDNLQLVEGNRKSVQSFDQYEDGFYDRITGLEGYRLEKPVYWRTLWDKDEISISGRLLGGCLDVLLSIVGTRFDKTKEFIEKYKDDGILWYLESFALQSEALTLGLWQLKEAGWFQYTKGFVFGRPAFYNIDSEITYEEAVLSMLEEYNVPIILDADIGHKAPQMTMVNGAMAKIHSKDGKGTVNFDFV